MLNQSGNEKELCYQDSYLAHILAHTIRSQDTDRFICIYDKIPETYTQNRVIDDFFIISIFRLVVELESVVLLSEYPELIRV